MKIVELAKVIGLRTFCPPDKVAQAIRALTKEAEVREVVIHGILIDSLGDTKDEFEVVLFGS